jgi:putative ABC transport system permease protein
MRRLARLLLLLYPKSFRARFEAEFLEAFEWHRARVPTGWEGRLRLTALMLRDTLAALPRAHSDGPRRMVHAARGLVADGRHAARGLARSPLFAWSAVASLALGIGANTAVFSVANAVLLQPLPYADPGRLTIVWNHFTTSEQTRLPLAPVEVAELAEEPGLFESVGGVWATSATVTDPEGTRIQVPAALVTPNFLGVLGIAPALGRNFLSELGNERRDEAPQGVLISHELWRSTFTSDPAVLERSLVVDGVSMPVLGVLPEGFRLIFPPDGSIPERLDVYRSLPWNLRDLPVGIRYLRVVGRLAPGVDLREGQVAVDAVSARVRASYPEIASNGDSFSIHPLQADAVREARPVLQVLLAAVGLFLLLASANVASLALARASARTGEMAVRRSLGASNGRIAGLVFWESLLIGVAAAVIGLAVGSLGADFLWSMRPEGIARVDSVSVDGTVVLFTMGVSTLAVLLFGWAPVRWTARSGVATTLRSAGARIVGARTSAREWITVGQVAVSLVLLCGAGLLARTLGELSRADVGFAPERLVSFKVALSEQLFPMDEERWRIASEIERRVQALPDVSATGATSHVPFGTWANWSGAAAPDGTPEAEVEAFMVDHRSVTPGYFGALGMTLESGRFFSSTDDGASEPVVVIDRVLADRAFPGEDAVGRRIHPTRYRGGEFTPTPATVIGVVGSVRDVSPSRPSRGQVFWPFAQSARWELTWVVRSQGGPGASLERVREEIRAVSPDLAVAAVAPLEELVREANAGTRFVALLGGVFALLALGLAGLGLYGVIVYSSSIRTAEFGLRRVVGARPRDILSAVIVDGLRLGALGTIFGIVAAMGLNRFLGSLLFGVSPTDAITMLLAAGVLLAVMLFASLVPALRAMRVDPQVAMRG